MSLQTIFSLMKGIKPVASVVLATVLLVLLPSCDKPPKEPDEPPILPPLDPVKKVDLSKIQPGEKVEVYVLEDDTFNGEYNVSSRGHIIVPRIGRVKVGGLTTEGAEYAVKRSLEKDQLTTAKVILERLTPPSSGDPTADNSIEGNLSGKVLRPGKYRLVGIAGSRPSAYQAVLQAGGCTRFANKKKAYILRRSADGRYIRIPVDLLAIEKGEAPDVFMAPGDTLHVPEKRVG